LYISNEGNYLTLEGNLVAQELSTTHLFADGFEIKNPGGGVFINEQGCLIQQGNAKIAVYNGNIYMSFSANDPLRRVSPTTISNNGKNVTVLGIS
jgi:hypothetical protein